MDLQSNAGRQPALHCAFLQRSSVGGEVQENDLILLEDEESVFIGGGPASARADFMFVFPGWEGNVAVGVVGKMYWM